MFEREKWMLAQAIAGVCRAANAPEGADEDNEQATADDHQYMDDVAKLLGTLCSTMQLESLYDIVNGALVHKNNLARGLVAAKPKIAAKSYKVQMNAEGGCSIWDTKGRLVHRSKTAQDAAVFLAFEVQFRDELEAKFHQHGNAAQAGPEIVAESNPSP